MVTHLRFLDNSTPRRKSSGEDLFARFGHLLRPLPPRGP